MQFDLVGRAIRRHVKGLNGQQTAHSHAYAYDGLGQLVRYQDPDQFGDPNRFARTTFDADGRWVRFVRSASASDQITLHSEYVDDPATGSSPTITRKDGRGLPTTWIYDAAYRLAEQRRPGYTGGTAHRTLIAYDAGSRPEWIVDGNNSYIHQQWDLAARRFTRTVAPGAAVSLLATEETVEFDPLGRIKKTWTDQGSSWNLLLGGVEFEWDSLGRLGKEAFTYTGIDITAPVNVTSGYLHGGSPVLGDTGFRRSLGYSSGFEIGSVPDSIGRLDTRTLELPGSSTPFNLATYTWGGATALERVLSVGGSSSITKTTALDNFRRLASLTHQVAGAGTPFEQRSFEWTPGGELLKRAWTKQDGTQGDLFQYDGHHRLIGAKLGVANISQPYGSASAAREVAYALEPGQSRDSVTETLNGGTPATTEYSNEADSSRYSQVGGIVPIYDGEGNLVFDGRYHLLDDFENRLSEIWELQRAGEQASATMQHSGGVNTERNTLNRGRREVLDRHRGELSRAIRESSRASRASSPLRGYAPTNRSAGSTLSSGESVEFNLVLIAAHGYDPFNRRIVRIVPGEGLDQRYAYDGWREVEELVPVTQGESTVAAARKALVWGARFTELLAYYRWNEAGGGTWDGYMVTQDEQGSVTALHDATGNLIERVEYDPYGEQTVFPAGGGSQEHSSVGLDFSYTTYRHDQETGLLYGRNRYLHAGWGQFVTMDPAGPWADASNAGNGYASVGNAPTTTVDPLGLWSVAAGSGGGGPASGDGGTCGAPGGGKPAGGPDDDDPCHRGKIKIETKSAWKEVPWWISKDLLKQRGGTYSARAEDIIVGDELVSGTLDFATNEDGSVSASFTPDPNPRSLALDMLATGLGIAAGIVSGPLGAAMALGALAAAVGQGAYTGDYTDAAIDVGLGVAGFGAAKLLARLNNIRIVNAPLCKECTAAGGGVAITAAEIRAINRGFGAATELSGSADTVIANMAYREGAIPQAATAIRDIAGRHLFDDANKRNAQVVAERLLGSGADPARIRDVIDRVATGDLGDVDDIATALR